MVTLVPLFSAMLSPVSQFAKITFSITFSVDLWTNIKQVKFMCKIPKLSLLFYSPLPLFSFSLFPLLLSQSASVLSSVVHILPSWFLYFENVSSHIFTRLLLPSGYAFLNLCLDSISTPHHLLSLNTLVNPHLLPSVSFSISRLSLNHQEKYYTTYYTTPNTRVTVNKRYKNRSLWCFVQCSHTATMEQSNLFCTTTR